MPARGTGSTGLNSTHCDFSPHWSTLTEVEGRIYVTCLCIGSLVAPHTVEGHKIMHS